MCKQIHHLTENLSIRINHTNDCIDFKVGEKYTTLSGEALRVFIKEVLPDILDLVNYIEDIDKIKENQI